MLSERMNVDGADETMRRNAACVLEVLAGLRSPEEAARTLGVSVPTYYNLEARALHGLLHGCRTESPGRKLALEKKVRVAEARAAELERQLQRYRAVLRNARRAARILGPDGDGDVADGVGRTPRIRATRAIDALRDALPPPVNASGDAADDAAAEIRDDAPASGRRTRARRSSRSE